MKTKKHDSILKMTSLAALTAVILILQMAGLVLRIPFTATSVNLVLIPIALGAMLFGPAAGAFLGFVCGLYIYIAYGVMGGDPFTAFLFNSNPLITAGICLIKTSLAGFLTGWIYRLISKKSEICAVFAASAITPVVNSGVFALGCFLMPKTMDAIASSEMFNMAGVSSVYFIFIVLIGINFVFELIVNLIFAPALQRIVYIVSHKIFNR